LKDDVAKHYAMNEQDLMSQNIISGLYLETSVLMSNIREI